MRDNAKWVATLALLVFCYIILTEQSHQQQQQQEGILYDHRGHHLNLHQCSHMPLPSPFAYVLTHDLWRPMNMDRMYSLIPQLRRIYPTTEQSKKKELELRSPQ